MVGVIEAEFKGLGISLWANCLRAFVRGAIVSMELVRVRYFWGVWELCGHGERIQ